MPVRASRRSSRARHGRRGRLVSAYPGKVDAGFPKRICANAKLVTLHQLEFHVTRQIGPAIELAVEMRGEVLRRAALRLEADGAQPLCRLRMFQRGVGRGV